MRLGFQGFKDEKSSGHCMHTFVLWSSFIVSVLCRNMWPEAQATAVGVVGGMAGFILAQKGDATQKKFLDSGDLLQLPARPGGERDLAQKGTRKRVDMRWAGRAYRIAINVELKEKAVHVLVQEDEMEQVQKYLAESFQLTDHSITVGLGSESSI